MNGSFPEASLTLGVNGLFYGTTVSGGSFTSEGTIFSFTPTPVPEPLTLLGASAAVAFGAAFKRRKNQG
ncbi:MAG: PEP-CTERM sorting domain-containing protein [Synechocystis sp.]